MKLSIIIPYYTNKKVLELCVEKILSEKINIDFELIIVNDNPSNDLKLNMQTSIKIISNEHNGGYSSAINCGVKHSIGEILLFVDSDIIPRVSAINHLLNFYFNHGDNKKNALSTFIRSSSTGLVTHAGVTFYKSDVLKPFRGFNFEDITIGKYCIRQAITSGILMISREAFMVVNGFNEQYFNGYCDIDLSLKVLKNGGRNIIVGGDYVFHRGRAAGKMRTGLELETKALFFKEWGNLVCDDHFEYLESISHHFPLKKKINKFYSVFDFSSSLFSAEYIRHLEKVNTFIANSYLKIRTFDNDIRLEDVLSWSLISQKEPFLFYLDSWLQIVENDFWFKQRKGKGDLIIDLNGRFIFVDDLLSS